MNFADFEKPDFTDFEKPQISKKKPMKSTKTADFYLNKFA